MDTKNRPWPKKKKKMALKLIAKIKDDKTKKTPNTECNIYDDAFRDGPPEIEDPVL